MEQIDWGQALIVTFVGVSTVFIMLTILIGVITLQKTIINGKTSKPVSAPVAQTPSVKEDKKETTKEDANIINTVIATAIHLHLKAKNSDRFITIKRIANSPWSVK